MMQITNRATILPNDSIALVMQDGQVMTLTRDQWHEAFVLVGATMYADQPTDLRQYAQDARLRAEVNRAITLLEKLVPE